MKSFIPIVLTIRNGLTEQDWYSGECSEKEKWNSVFFDLEKG